MYPEIGRGWFLLGEEQRCRGAEVAGVGLTLLAQPRGSGGEEGTHPYVPDLGSSPSALLMLLRTVAHKGFELGPNLHPCSVGESGRGVISSTWLASFMGKRPEWNMAQDMSSAGDLATLWLPTLKTPVLLVTQVLSPSSSFVSPPTPTASYPHPVGPPMNKLQLS